MNKRAASLILMVVVTLACGSAVSGQEGEAGLDSNLTTDLTADLSNDQLFEKAVGYYENRQFDQAAELYTSILARGVESAPVYFNLGNAKFKAGELGFAVLYYHRALRLEPGDEDIASNLEFAKLFTSIQMEGVKLNPVTTFLESLIGPYKLSLLAWICSVCFISLMLLLIIRYGVGLNGPTIRAGIVATVTLLIIVGSLTTFKYNTDYLVKRAVLVADECPVRSGPSQTLEVEFDAAPGLVVEILSESGSYYNVLFENKRRGWVKKQLVAVI